MFNLFKKVLSKTNDAIKEVAPTKKKEISKEDFEKYEDAEERLYLDDLQNNL